MKIVNRDNNNGCVEMKKYYVRLPMAGIIGVSVEAESEEEAIDIAINTDLSIDNIEEWDVCNPIVRGNVCYAPLWEAEAEEE